MKTLKLFIILAVFAAGFGACTVYRGTLHGAPKITSYKLFENDTINPAADPWHFAQGNDPKFDTTRWTYRKKGELIAQCTIDSLFTYGKSTAFLVVRNDSILLERYYMGRKRDEVSTVYSISKTLTCLLAEIAIDQGFIASIDDPVRKYLPELGNQRDNMFNKLTIRHLMDMRAMINHPETYNVDPFSKLARLFYGRNAMGQLKKLKLDAEPGSKGRYQSVSTEILGVVIERATGVPLAKYMQEQVWKPLGMEYKALLSLDSKKNRVPKAFGGFAVTAVDLAKIGRLYLNNGNWNGVQIIDSSWVKISKTPNLDNYGYQLSWRNFDPRVQDSTGSRLFADSMAVVNRITAIGENPAEYKIWQAKIKKEKGVYGKWLGLKYHDSYYALGILDQVMLLDPNKNTILIRLGHQDKFANYVNLLDKVDGNL